MKTFITYAVVLLAMTLPSLSFCQSEDFAEPGNSIRSFSLSVGLNNYRQTDRYLSPYIFSGTIFGAKAAYDVRSGENAQRVELLASLGPLRSSVQPRDVYQDVGLLSYSYLHDFGHRMVWNNPLHLSAGGGLSSLVMNTDFNIVDNRSGITVYDQSWYWHHSLNLVLSVEYLPGAGKRLAVRLTAPVAGFVSRPKNGHWLNADNEEVIHNFGNAAVQGEFEPFWEAPVLFTAVEYSQSVAGHLNFRGTYSFAYAASNRPADILSMGMYMNGMLLGLEWEL